MLNIVAVSGREIGRKHLILIFGEKVGNEMADKTIENDWEQEAVAYLLEKIDSLDTPELVLALLRSKKLELMNTNILRLLSVTAAARLMKEGE